MGVTDIDVPLLYVRGYAAVCLSDMASERDMSWPERGGNAMWRGPSEVYVLGMHCGLNNTASVPV